MTDCATSLWHPAPTAVSPRRRRETYRALQALERGCRDWQCAGLDDHIRRAAVAADIASALPGMTIIATTRCDFLRRFRKFFDPGSSPRRLLPGWLRTGRSPGDDDVVFELIDDAAALVHFALDHGELAAAVVDAPIGFGNRAYWRECRRADRSYAVPPCVWLGGDLAKSRTRR